MAIWIFQGNPEIFDIDGYLNASDGSIKWRVTRYAEQISEGDLVYIWRSAGKDPKRAGIVASGVIIEPPSDQEDDVESEPFWTTRPEKEIATRARIRLTKVANAKQLIKRDWLVHVDSRLKNLSILKQPAGTNFKVEPEEAQRIEQLWQRTGVPWSRDEVVAALLLYEDLFGKPVSKTLGSPVEILAQRLGRSPTGVYNKLMNFRSFDPRIPQKGMDSTSELDEVVWDEFFDTGKNKVRFNALLFEFNRLWSEADAPALESSDTRSSEEKRFSKKSLADLWLAYRSRKPNSKPRRKVTRSYTYNRDDVVVALRKSLADYKCEIADCPGPKFETDDDEAFVEVHHILPLAAGGPDTIENTAALCPTHHSMAHNAKPAIKNEIRSFLELLRSNSD